MRTRKPAAHLALLSLALFCLPAPGCGGGGRSGSAAGEGAEPGGAAAGEATRTLRLEVDPARGPIRIENLAGSLTVVPGSGAAIEAIATVHAASEDLAGLVSFEVLPGDPEGTLLRVVYPLAEHRHLRYGDPDDTGSNWLNLFGAGESNTGFSYAGEQVRVSRSRGVPLWADVEVRLPAADVSVSFLNAVGPVHARGVRGSLAFETYSGEQVLEDLSGHLEVEISSGEATIARHRGSVTCDSASGEVFVQDFEGTDLACDSASGDVIVTGAVAEAIRIETASGDIKLERVSGRLLKASTASGAIDADGVRVAEVQAGTASGDVSFVTGGESPEKIDVGTANGDVRLLLEAATGFELWTDIGHGRIENGFEDSEPIRDGEDVVGYRRGDGRTRIDVRMVHGSLAVMPRRESPARHMDR